LAVPLFPPFLNITQKGRPVDERIQGMKVVEEMVDEEVKEPTGQNILKYIIWIVGKGGILLEPGRRSCEFGQ
jgi:hypothetical protein